MIRVKNTLAVLAFATMFGCGVEAPASTPTTEQVSLTLYATYSSQPLIRELTRHYIDIRPEFAIAVEDNSYSRLIGQITDHAIDYFVSSYVPSDDDVWVAPIARDGLILIAHPENPIIDLDTDTIRDIFSGHLKDWETISEIEGAIIPLTYQNNDDVYHEFHRLVMGQHRVTSNAQVVPNTDAMLQQIATTPNAIGYLPLSYLTDGVKVISIDGIQPSPSTLSDNIYPLRITLFMIGREEPSDEYRTFFSWIQSRDGQAIVSQNYVPLP